MPSRQVAIASSVGLHARHGEVVTLTSDDEAALDEQTETYRAVFEAFAGRKVVVRTLDAGADKPLKFADLGAEENPALGVRGLRLPRRRTRHRGHLRRGGRRPAVRLTLHKE